MDDSPPLTQFRSESTTINHGSALYAGAYFPRSQNFSVSGSTFVSNNYNEPAMLPDFRRIPLGDINLKHEIRLRGRSGVVDRYRVWGCVRRVYSARIFGDNSDMTVAVYHGDTAEEDWRDTISKYSHLCHPNFVQIFAAASRFGIHAIVVQDDLMPPDEFLELYCKSSILTVYIHGCWDNEYYAANHYVKHMFGSYWPDSKSTFWIRRSNGRLCMDLMPSDVATSSFWFQGWRASFDHILPFHDPNSEAIVIDSLELGEYHSVCYWYLAYRQTFPVSTQAELHLGGVVHSPLGFEPDGLVEIAFLPNVNLAISSWQSGMAVRNIMDNGWTCYKSARIFGTTIHSSVNLKWDYPREAWLSQAHHIFHRLQMKSDYEEYVIVERIRFWLKISETAESPPPGYLFVCPVEDMRCRVGSHQWPNCPAYWSRDPSGAERLSAAEATDLGFPPIELNTDIKTVSWDACVYTGLHNLHVGKGFDPYSQEIARHLGHPLYQLSHEMEAPFAYVDEVSGVEMEREDSYTDTTEADHLEHECLSDSSQISLLDVAESAPQSWTWKAVMFVKLGLIVASSFGLLYEYEWAARSQ